MPNASVVTAASVAFVVVHLQDQKAQNTGGGTFTSGAWRTRDLNVEVSDSAAVCTLASNQFTLAAGDYLITAVVPAYGVTNHQAKLVNVTDANDLLLGNSSFSGAADSVANESLIIGKFTVAASKALEIQHKCSSTLATNGFGLAGNQGTEVYTNVLLQKIA